MFAPHLPNGLARAAIRFKPSSFVGTFVALLMAAAIVSACGILLETGTRASVPAERYAKAPVLVAADQQAHLVEAVARTHTTRRPRSPAPHGCPKPWYGRPPRSRARQPRSGTSPFPYTWTARH